jgi:parallel beta-helix repeat protein
MRLRFNGANNVRLKAVTIKGATLIGSTRNIRITASTFTGAVTFDGVVNSNIVLAHNTHNDIDAGGQFASPARIHLAYPSAQHSGVTIRDSLFSGGSADGIQAGPALNLIDNEFANIREGTCADCHTDAIQLFSGSGGPGVGSTIRGNYIHDCSTGIVAFDGTNDNLIEDNVVEGIGGHSITLGGDSNSIVRHNTVTGPYGLDLTSRAGTSSRGTVVQDNILPAIYLHNGVGGDASPALNTHNMLRSGATAPNLNGTPIFLGGLNPTTYTGFHLAPTSPGKNAATDTTDVGIH